MVKKVVKMQILYNSKKIEKICSDASKAEKKYGFAMTIKLFQRLDQIQAVTTIDELIQYKIGRCHLLVGKRKGQYAMDLEQPYRLVFTVDKTNNVHIANIIEIVDYH